MASTDIDGTPILILSLPDVKTLLHPASSEAKMLVVEKLRRFVNDPQCVEWLRENFQ